MDPDDVVIDRSMRRLGARGNLDAVLPSFGARKTVLPGEDRPLAPAARVTALSPVPSREHRRLVGRIERLFI